MDIMGVDLKKYQCAGCGLTDSEDRLSFIVYPVRPQYPSGFYIHKDRPRCKRMAAFRLDIHFPAEDPAI